MSLIGKIKNMINQKKIIYSSEVCSDCQLAEKFFKNNKIDIEIKHIENQENRKELKKRHGKVLVPTIILGNDKFIGFEQNKDMIKKKLNL
ncbi:Glutaredoxin [Halanaerobium congolense]|jgi:glutaredoxin 3|uniref:Glutaredoxin n=1 Tax=Halanaerobium congolense TaxID=54121 RepID=A0A1G8PFK4_9FIRM|nr:glutaredoxin family protein [Halanaerobium congolense]KXS49138.1 MAG: hypothetical protein AWL62_1310 [Halanaerobium sp. T82-1]PUU92245.1 MAG: hypothetical protein CI948_767 [Halanaerobium sp.]SDI91273.1 Glutaredoxin [Halanaerobium congolense]SET58883.1 Glutaredoxin [Halanaerobium congolense]